MRSSASGLLIALALGSPFVSSGCGGRVKTETQELTVETYPLAYAHAICDSIGPCCERNARRFDVNECKQRYRGVAQDNVLASQGQIFDERAALDCFARVTSLVSDCRAMKPNEFKYELSLACVNVFVGTKAPGELCERDQECAPGTMNAKCKHGKCVAYNRTLGGETCIHSDECRDQRERQQSLAWPSVRTFYCHPETRTCKRVEPEGGRCFEFDACAQGTYCEFDDNTCRRGNRLGEDCSNDRCASGMWCNIESEVRTCRLYQKPGEPCSNSHQCEAGMCRYGRCDSSPAADLCGMPN